MIEMEKPSWWRSSAPPPNWSRSGGRWHGRVVMPEHLYWSGPTSAFDLDDPAESHDAGPRLFRAVARQRGPAQADDPRMTAEFADWRATDSPR